MQKANYFDDVLKVDEIHTLFRNPRQIEGLEDGSAALEGEVTIGDCEVTLRLVLNASFPLTLPRFFLCPWDALGIIPHVDRRGFVCFADSEGLIVDRRRPVQIIEDAFQRVRRILSDGINGQNRIDFANEFESYWEQLPGITEVLSLVDPVDEVAEVYFATDKEKWIVQTSEKNFLAFNNGVKASYTLQRALYLPLKPGAVVIPPRPDHPFWTAEEVRLALLPHLSNTNIARLRKLLKRNVLLKEFLVVKLPRPRGGATLFGIQYEGISNQHPLREKGKAAKLTPLKLQRRDRGYIIRRGGGDVSLETKRVLLAGCGSLGGRLAFELARSGVLNLTLVDCDVLTADNTFRHVLGRLYWGRKKVEALKVEIEKQLPYTQIKAVDSTFEEALSNGLIDLAKYDLIVLALGNPTVELEINERVHALERGPRLVFTWLEPLGIGGHALLANNASSGGCFECLYTPIEEGEETLENRAAFAAPGQSFGQALSGCATSYTPYGSIDAVRTTALAARLAVDVLSGKENGNPLFSWKGDATTFRTEGFRLSKRYNATEEQLFDYRYKYANKRCRVCGVEYKENHA